MSPFDRDDLNRGPDDGNFDPAADHGRPFPDEADWLHLPWPAAGSAAGHDAANATPDRPTNDGLDGTREAGTRDAGTREAGPSAQPAADFVARTLAALAAERQLDADLAALAPLLPKLLLEAYAAPAPTKEFVERTLHRVRAERQARWRQLLAKHVAPEPSPQFVARTLAALDDAREPTTTARPALVAVGRARPGAGGVPLGWLGLAAAAAVAAVLFRQAVHHDESPLELRLARATSPAYAHANALSALASVLATLASRDDPEALAPALADGIWLQLERSR